MENITFLYTFKCEQPPQKGFQLQPGSVCFYGKVYFKVQLMLFLHQRSAGFSANVCKGAQRGYIRAS